MPLSTYLQCGRHIAQLHSRHRRRRRAYAPTSNAAAYDNHEKINSWVSFSSLNEYGAPLGGRPELCYYTDKRDHERGQPGNPKTKKKQQQKPGFGTQKPETGIRNPQIKENKFFKFA